METTSCQIQGLDKNLWLKFRQIALSEGVSASGKVRAMIEAAVASNGDNLCSPAEQKLVERKDQ
ncbi:MAG: hypothetical protein ACLQVJ_07255 [Syntrophobacteraceae bacterium]